MVSSGSSLFPALLKHWRRARGLSQLDLALQANVSARHVSFLETGKARPSRPMVLRLASSLDVPLRDQNAMLRAADLEEAFEEPGVEEVLEGALGHAVSRMLEHHAPYPMMLFDRRYDVVRANAGARWLMERFVAAPDKLIPPINGFHLLFAPDLVRPFVVGWERIAKDLLGRLHREVLHERRDGALRDLLDEIKSLPDVPDDIHELDLTEPSLPTFTLELRRDDLEVSFFGTVTVFSAPQNVTVDELRIESYFPADRRTVELFESL